MTLCYVGFSHAYLYFCTLLAYTFSGLWRRKQKTVATELRKIRTNCFAVICFRMAMSLLLEYRLIIRNFQFLYTAELEAVWSRKGNGHFYEKKLTSIHNKHCMLRNILAFINSQAHSIYSNSINISLKVQFVVRGGSKSRVPIGGSGFLKGHERSQE